MEHPTGRALTLLTPALFVLALAGDASAQDTQTRTLTLGGGLVQVQISSSDPDAAIDPAVAEQLLRLEDRDPTTRLEAARALGELADPVAVGPLGRRAREDPRPEIRGWALRALHRIGTPEALQHIRDVGERDADPRVRTLAARLLASTAPPPVAQAQAEPQPPAAQAPAEPAPPPATDDAVEAPADVPIPAPAEIPEPAERAPSPETPFSLGASVTVGVGAPPAEVEPPVVGAPPAEVEPPVVVVPDQVGGPPYGAGAPAGYDLMELRRVRRAGLGLRIAGWTVFGLTYFTSFMAGLAISQDDGDDGWPLMLPLVGPAITGFRIIAEDGELAGLGALAIIWSAAEIAGFAMAIAGHVRRRRARRTLLQRVAVAPTGPRGSAGLSLAAAF